MGPIFEAISNPISAAKKARADLFEKKNKKKEHPKHTKTDDFLKIIA